MNDSLFWNDPETTTYFFEKPADPRIVAFIRSYNRPTEARALDLGCGGGRHSELLASHGFATSAVDINVSMLEATRHRLNNAHLEVDIRKGSIIDIPYDAESFDIIIATGVLHQARSVTEYQDAVTDLSRVLKPGGYVLLNIFTNTAWDDSYTRVGNSKYVVRTKENLLMTLLPKDKFVSLMLRNGMQLVDDQGEDTKMENTGPRSVYRAFFRKAEV